LFKTDAFDEIDRNLSQIVDRIDENIKNKDTESKLLRIMESSLMELDHDKNNNSIAMFSHHLLDKDETIKTT